jgi:ATP-dependent DNA helicase RecQ
MLLDDIQVNTDEQYRKLYVGITRAKRNLFIHCNTPIFTSLIDKNIDYKKDTNLYKVPDEITLALTMHDVFLDYFKGKKKLILSLHSGQPLRYDNGFFGLDSGEKVACISKQARETLESCADKGYLVYSAKVDFILAWKGKEDTEETAVLLPKLLLKKS